MTRTPRTIRIAAKKAERTRSTVPRIVVAESTLFRSESFGRG
jgi:hypothetical protein